MDGVLVDFGHQVKNIMNDPTISNELKDRPDLIKNIFLDPPPIDGAIDAINKLKESNKYELFIATTALGTIHQALCTKDYGLKIILETFLKKGYL